MWREGYPTPATARPPGGLGLSFAPEPRPFVPSWAPGAREKPAKGCDRSLKVVVKDPEEFEQALREFRRKVQEQGLVREMRRRAHYVPPAEARKIKSLRARRRRTR